MDGSQLRPRPHHEADKPTAIIRSEEQLHVTTEQVQIGTARLVKYTVTEYVTLTVLVYPRRGPGRVRTGHRPRPGLTW